METKNETEIQLMRILFKTNGKKATKNIVSKRAYPHGIEMKYFRQLKSYFKPLTDYVNNYISENLEPLLHGDSTEVRFDTIPGNSFRKMIYSLEDWLSVYMPDISELPSDSNNNVIFVGLGKTADETMEFSEKEFKRIIEKGIHVNLPVSAPWWDDMKKSWAEDNYTLITSNAKNYVSKINTLTEQAIVNGLSPMKLKEEIKKATESLSDKHCKLLARDQMGKLNGQITEAQMTEVGLDMYVWSTSYDDRVRDSHAVMEGLLCTWDDASICSYDNGKTWVPRPADAVDLHPGQDIQCRCVALAFYPELVSEMEGIPISEVISEDMIENNAYQLDILNKDFVQTDWRVSDESERIQPKKCEELSELYKMAEKAHPEFSSFTKNMMDGFDFNYQILERPKLKGKDRIEEKLRTDQLKSDLKGKDKNKYYNALKNKYNTRYILDIDGNTIAVDDVSQVQEILKKYSDNKAVLRVKNNFAIPSPVGYSDINMNLRMPNGVIVETQINTTANIVAKEYGHSLYEVYRSIDTNMDFKRLADKMGEVQTNLYKVSRQLSLNGDFPKVKGDIFKFTYKPYEKILKDGLTNDVIKEYKKAKNKHLFNDDTVKHFEELLKKLGLHL